jgi:nitrite reductase/ring-hydroxylating ferredoxin subunit
MRPLFRSLSERLHGAQSLDPLGKKLRSAIYAVVPNGTARKDMLAGTWLGHPVHPLLTDVVVGAWTGAMLLDLGGGEAVEDATDALIGIGALAAVPTAVTGLVDWSDHDDEQGRVGLVHAALNTAALLMYSVSLGLRRSGHRGAGKALSLSAFATASASAYLGGHMAYGQGLGVNQTAFEAGVSEWKPVMAREKLPEGEPAVAEVDGTSILLYRRGEDLLAISNRCSHRGCPLSDGDIDERASSVTCPCHGSTFHLETGQVLHGPATAPQPAYEARFRRSKVEVRLRPGV